MSTLFQAIPQKPPAVSKMKQWCVVCFGAQASSADEDDIDRLAQPSRAMARRSILAAMMKSFSCNPLIFLVCNDTVIQPQPKQISG
jgi:hypothetical protein